MALTTNSKLMHLPVTQLKKSEIALRNVNKDSEEYAQLVEDIRKRGILTPPMVRESVNKETHETEFVLVDGLHRVTAAEDAGLETVPVHIVQDMTEIDILQAQIAANVHKVETKPAEYAQQLRRILALAPLMTMNELASSINKSPSWLSQRLTLTKLSSDIQTLVDESRIPLMNAYALAKLPSEEQVNYVDAAMTEDPAQFANTVLQRAKELREAARQGRNPDEQQFEAIPRLRKLAEIKAVLDDKSALISDLNNEGLSTPGEILNYVLLWVVRLDPKSYNAAKEDFERKKAEREERKQIAARKREIKRAEEAAEKRAELEAKAEVARKQLEEKGVSV